LNPIHRSLALAAVVPLLTGCIVLPGRTAGETWGGAYSARFAPPEEKKKEEKKEEKKEGKKEEPPAPPPPAGPHDRPGYLTRVVKERLWVFRKGSKDLAEFLKKGESAKSVTLVGRGPDGMSLRAPDAATAEAYLAALAAAGR
jgi:hypothetical protein